MVYILEGYLHSFILAFFLLYYILYIRYQAVQGFYTYWDKFFLPHSLSAYPQYFKEVWIRIYEGFTPFNKGSIIPFYMIIGIFGLYGMYQYNKSLCVVSIISYILYLALSLCKIYPFGHVGIIGGRLSLFMSPIFYLSCTYGMIVLYAILQKVRLGMFVKFVGIMLCIITLHAHKSINSFYQQSHKAIQEIANNMQDSDILFIYTATKPAFQYYTFRENFSKDFIILQKDLKELESLSHSNTTSWILITHFLEKDRDKKVLAKIKKNQNITLYKDSDMILVKVQPQS